MGSSGSREAPTTYDASQRPMAYSYAITHERGGGVPMQHGRALQSLTNLAAPQAAEKEAQQIWETAIAARAEASSDPDSDSPDNAASDAAASDANRLTDQPG
jgi:hypothetical protein